MRRLVFITQHVDPGHAALANTVRKVKALADQVDELVVLADAVVPSALPANARARSFRSATKLGRGARFEATLVRELTPRPIAVVAHMCPIYAVLAAPLVRPLGIPLLLWFTHWKPSRTLVLAERASTAILTVDRRSFPLDSGKVVAIGHGIDLEDFRCTEREPAERLRVVALGRTSPAKGFETIVRAAVLAGVDLEVRGPSFTAEERAERQRLEACGARVEEPIPYGDVPALLEQKDVLVNNMREGALDKVVYEAAATCMPVLASNSGFEDVLPAELRFGRDDPEGLAEKLRSLAGTDRNAIGRELRARVEARHSVEHWAEEVIRVARNQGGTGMIVLHVQKVGGISGSEAHLLTLLPDLKKRGWDIRFLMLHEHEPGAWEFARELEAGGVPVDAIPMTADVDPATFARVLAYLVTLRPTILHTHLVHADAYGQTAGTLARVPVRLSTKHGFNEFREGRLFALGDRTIGALAHRQIAISRGLARYLAQTEGFLESDFEVIHYGIAARPEPEPYAGGAPHFLCIGRLIPIKGHIVLLRAFRRVLDERPDVRLDIAGRGVLEHGLKDLARELGLTDAVHFLGHVTPVQRAIEQSVAVVVPSLGEGFGMVALEAMERARPVIAASIGGLDDLVRDGVTGLLVAPGDAESLAQAMLQLASDPDRVAAMGRAARVRAVERFPEDRCTERTEEVYRFWLDGRLNGRPDPGRNGHHLSIAAAASSAITKSQGTR